MGARVLISTAELPGFTGEGVAPDLAAGITSAVAVRDRLGVAVGTVVYTSRPAPGGGTEYGWRPAGRPRVALSTKVDAVRRLIAG